MMKMLIDLYTRLAMLEDYIKTQEKSEYNDDERIAYYMRIKKLVSQGYDDIVKLHEVIEDIEKLTKDEINRIVRLQDEIVYN